MTIYDTFGIKKSEKRKRSLVIKTGNIVQMVFIYGGGSRDVELFVALPKYMSDKAECISKMHGIAIGETKIKHKGVMHDAVLLRVCMASDSTNIDKMLTKSFYKISLILNRIQFSYPANVAIYRLEQMIRRRKYGKRDVSYKMREHISYWYAMD